MYDQRMAIGAGLAAAGLLSGCHLALGEYGIAAEANDERCLGDEDCSAEENQGCDRGRCAIRCLDDAPCPAFSECWAATYCTEPIGTPCDPASPSACGGYLCRDRDIAAQPVAGYCPGYCNEVQTPCPEGFVCHQLSCYRE